jgi:hypothetical protein
MPWRMAMAMAFPIPLLVFDLMPLLGPNRPRHMHRHEIEPRLGSLVVLVPRAEPREVGR